ncbi:MAG TPA: TRAP transporter small permease [Usitatibacter sp.]|nr:TRAP transporter small permease [Usitatibacter sp.]
MRIAPLLGRLSALNAVLARWALYIACACLAGLLVVVVYGVVMRYAFNNAPAYVEQVSLLLVISVAMFAASAGVRDTTHIGMDSLVSILPAKVRLAAKLLVQILTILFALALTFGGGELALSLRGDTIPTLGISEAFRYAPVVLAGVAITLFAIEHILALWTGKEVARSWH